VRYRGGGSGEPTTCDVAQGTRGGTADVAEDGANPIKAPTNTATIPEQVFHRHRGRTQTREFIKRTRDRHGERRHPCTSRPCGLPEFKLSLVCATLNRGPVPAKQSSTSLNLSRYRSSH
jgi:hypothetical protein